MKKFGLLLLLPLFFSACQKEAENSGNGNDYWVRGTVVDAATQSPLYGIYVRLYSALYYEGVYCCWTEIGSDHTAGDGGFLITYGWEQDAMLLTFSSVDPKYKKIRINGGNASDFTAGYYFVVGNKENYKVEFLEN